MIMRFDWKFKAAFVAVGLLFGFIISEAALELIGVPGSQQEYESLDDLRLAMLDFDDTKQDHHESLPLAGIINPNPNDKIIYDLRPDLDVVFQNQPVQTNSCGMRDKERTIAKPFDTYRIALLGDSFTFGWGVGQDESFAVVLENVLNDLSKGKPKFEVLNFGVPGYSTFQEVAKFKESGADFDPDAVLVFFVQNDFGLPFYVKDVARPGQLMDAVSFARLASKTLDPEREQQRIEMLGFGANRALAELADFTNDRGIKLSVVINPRPDWRDDYNLLWVLRERNDINFIRLRKSYKEIINRRGLKHKDLTLPTDPHPSAYRHVLLGQMLATYFMEVLA